MNTYNQHAMKQKRADYLNIVLPLLTKSGYEKQKIVNLFENGQVRVRWGKDWNNFTVHLTNPRNEPTCVVDNLVHLVWGGAPVPNKLIMACFIERMGIGPVSSLAITDLYTLANGLKNHGVSQNNRNSFNGQTFMTLPFSHPSLSKNISGIGIRPLVV